MESNNIFVNSISVVEDSLSVFYEKHDENGLFTEKAVFYSFKNGLEQIDNTIITDDNSYMLSHEINGVMDDLEQIGVI